MFGEFPAAFFSSSVGTTYVVVFLVVQVLSLLLLAAVVWEFRQLQKRHQQFFSAMQGSERADPEHGPMVILWVYILGTVCTVIVTSVFFLLRPHLL